MMLAATIPQPASHASGHLLTQIVFTILIMFAILLFLFCIKKLLDIVDEEERIRRERRADHEVMEKRNHQANGKNHDCKN